MGRQVNFFLSNDDQAELTEKLDSLGTIVAAAESSDRAEVIALPVSAFARWTVGLGWPLLFRPEDRSGLIVESGRLHVADFGVRYYIERYKNPIVEFATCIEHQNEIQRGRLYYEAKYLDNASGAVIEKSPEFIVWATKIFNVVKKSTTKDAHGYYIGKGAQALQRRGYAFV
jgi:hypothetical protein